MRLGVPKRRFDKLFNAEEAEELIPRLEFLIRELQSTLDGLRKKIGELAKFDDRLEQLELPAIVSRYPELKPAAARIADYASEIEAMGCFLKDIDQGLVDFPSKIDDDQGGSAVAFLCWQFGERKVLAWHPLNGGFAQRRPLPGVPKQYLN